MMIGSDVWGGEVECPRRGVDVGCVGEARSDTERRDRAVFGPGLDPSGWDSGLGWELRSAIGESKPDTAPN